MAEPSADRTDWALVAHNVRWARTSRDLTQRQLAERAGLHARTIATVEKAKPVGDRTLERIAGVFGYRPSDLTAMRRTLNLKRPDQPFALSRSSDLIWSEPPDRRRVQPPDNSRLIQGADERRRLGRLGFVTHFSAGLKFVMPRGPGMVFVEVYGESGLDAPFYRDCFYCCFRGALRLTIGDESVVLEEGDVIGCGTETAVRIEPLRPLEADERPPLLQWIGANRVGQPAISDEITRVRVRPSRLGEAAPRPKA